MLLQLIELKFLRNYTHKHICVEHSQIGFNLIFFKFNIELNGALEGHTEFY